MSDVQWTVGGGGHAAPEPQSNKIPFVALQRSNDKMTDSQKEGVRVWNAMVQALRDNGLMEDKKEGA